MRQSRSFKALFAILMSGKKKDYYFRIRNRGKADKTVLKFIYSPNVKKDRRLYAPCHATYKKYVKYCKQNGLKTLSSWKFKKNMQLLGFVYKKHHRFYEGYYSNRITTAYKNIGINGKN